MGGKGVARRKLGERLIIGENDMSKQWASYYKKYYNSSVLI